MIATLVLALALSSPSSGRCAGAWNLHPNASAKKSVIVAHTRQASVEPTTAITYVDTPTGSRRTKISPACVVVFFLSKTTVLTLQGIWKNNTISTWHSLGRRSMLGGDGNACVARNGTIHGVGPFTAETRC